MIWIRVFYYTMPSLKHIFIVVYSLSSSSDNPKLLPRNRTSKEYFDCTVQSKLHEYNNTNIKWTIRTIHVDDFLSSIASLTSMPQSRSNLFFHSPECMELLTINLSKIPPSLLDLSLDTPKVLSKISEEDVIEIFI